MLNVLKFVQGAVAKKDFVPALTHFHIHDGIIHGFNGVMSITSPINISINAKPKAGPFIKAIQTCKEETTALSITPSGRLAIKSGSFRAYIDCTEDEFPENHPEGDMINLPNGILEHIKVLSPFIAEDASRPWATGILFRGGSAFATNNVIICEKWLGYTFPREVNIPVTTVKELLRIGEEPEKMQLSERSVTFYYSGDRRLTTQLTSLEWPDVSPILERPANPVPFPDGFFDALEDLRSFADERDRVIFRNGEAKTAEDSTTGAVVEMPGILNECGFQITQLQKLQPVATTIDFTMYPTPCCFFGDNLRGAIVGMVL